MCTTSFIPASGTWATASNWTAGIVPSSSDVACVPSGAVVTTTATAQAGVVWAPDAKIVVAAGSLIVSDTVTASQLRDLTLSGGQLDGAATINVSGALDWAQGSMVGSGATVLGSTGTGTIHAGAYGLVTLATRTLRNDGTLSFSSGSLRGDTGALIDNRGTFRVDSQDSTYSQGSGMYTNYNGAQARISNTGTIVKSSGTGRTWIGYAIDNDGIVSAQSGDLYFYGGGVSGDTSTGAWSASAGADVNLAQGTFNLGSGIALSGTVLMGATVNTASLQSPSGSVNITGGTLTVTDTASTSQIKDLTISGGNLAGAATLSVTGSLDWSAGLMSGTGMTRLESSASGTIHSAANSWVTLVSRTLRNDGSLTFSAGSLRGDSGALVDNRGTLRLNSQDAQGSQGSGFYTNYNGAQARISNTGSILKSSGTGRTMVGFAVDNDGTVSAQTGELYLYGGGISGDTATGGWTASSGADVNLAQGTFTLGSGIAMSGTVLIAGTATAASLQATNGSVNITGIGSLTITDTASTSQLKDLTLSGGSLAGAATLSVTGSLDWSSGAMNGTGLTRLESSATGTIHSAANSWVTLATRTLRNDGSLTFSAGSLRGDSGALIDNRGTLRLNSQDAQGSQGSGFYTNYNGAQARISNTGSIIKSSGSGRTQVGFAVDNDGTVSAQTGELYFYGGGISGDTATGGWSASAGADVNLGQGTFTLGSDIAMSGAILIGGTVNAASLQGPNASATLSGNATLSVNDSANASYLKDLTLNGGTVAGAGTLNVSGTLDWSAGAMSGTGSTVLGTNATGTMHSSSNSWLGLTGRTIRNDGTLTWSSGSLRGDYGGLIDNRGTFRANAEDGTGLYNYWGTVPQIKNTGVVLKSAGTGLTRIFLNFDNSGAVSAQTGELLFGAGGIAGQAANGSWTAATGAKISLAQSATPGTFTLGSDVAMSGTISITGTVNAGNIDAQDASLTVSGNGSLAVTDPARASYLKDLTIAAATISGSGTLNLSGTLDWASGSMTGPGATILASGATGTIHSGSNGWVTLDQRVLANRGLLTWSSGYIRGFNHAVLDNSGTFHANSEDGGMISYDATTSVLNNVAAVTKTVGTGTTNVGWGLGQGGVFSASTGSLQATGPAVPVASAAAAQAGAANPAVPNGQRSCAGKPVDCATGNQFEIQTDLAIGGRGLGLQATRTYNSQAAATATSPGAFGYGWTGSYSDHLVVSAAYRTATVYHADGSAVAFTDYGSGNYQPAAWVQSTLTQNPDGSYSYKLPSQLVMTFGSDGRLLSETDRNNNATTMTYSSGRLISVTDPAGRSLTYSYDADGTIASISDPTGLTANYAYATGNLTSVSYAGVSGERWHFGYDTAHQMTSMTDARGHTTSTAYDSSHRVTSQTDALDRTRTWAYAPDETTITNPGGDVTHEIFDNGQPVRITRAQGTPIEATTTLSYDANRALKTVTDPSGRTTSYGYDAAGDRTSVTVPGGRTTTLTYNATRDVTSATAPSGKTTTFAYDSHGNVTSVTRSLEIADQGPVHQTTTFAYDAHGDQTSITDPLQHTTTLDYDGRGNLITRTDPLGHTTSWSYDDASRAASVTTPRGHEPGADPSDFTTTIQRDALGRPIGSTDGLGRHTSTTYDALGNVTSETDAEGRTATAVYDAENQLSKTTRPGGGTSHTSYDANGQVTSTTDPNAHTTTYVRDALSRVSTATDPLSHHTTFGYDHSGRMTSQTDPAGETTSYTYSPAGALTGIDYQDPATHDVSFSYDADGQRTGMTDATGQTAFSRDTLGRLASVTDGDNHTVAYSYDLADRQTAVTYLGGDQVTRSYDPADRVTAITDWLGNTTSYGYDAEDDPTTITYPSSTKDVEQFAYDRAGRATSQTISHDGTDRAAFAYAYNAADQLTTQTDTGDLTASDSYDYDTHGRLGADGSDAFAYDDSGNLNGLRGAALSYDAADRLTSSAQAGDTTTYGYDQIGNRTQTAPPTGPLTDYGYDQADQLTSVEDHTGSPITYTYAADGLRATKTKNAQTTAYTWDRSATLPVLLAKDSTRYVYDPAGLALEQIDSDGNVSYVHHDRLGSTRLVTDADGSTQARYTYDAYGNRTTTGSSSVPFGYTGQYTDSDTGLVYMRARYYDPATGQFLTRDPLEASTRQRYLYAGDDPINQTDPTGLLFGADTLLAGAIGGVVGGVAGAGGYLYGVANGTQSFSVSELAASTAANAVGGAAAGACLGTTYVAVVACGAVGGAAASIIDDGLHRRRPSTSHALEGAAFGAGGGALGQRLYALRGFRPYRWRNLLNPGKNAQLLYAQGILGGAVGLTPSLFGSAPAYGDSPC